MATAAALDGSSGALFQWRPPATISAQLPNPAGPARGATQLTIIGGGFGADAGAAVECRFGAATVRAARASGTSVACLTPEARWAGLMLGAPEGSPHSAGLGPDLSGPWTDSEGRRLHVCAMHGALAVAVPEAGTMAVAVWDVQRRGYVGMWQQWQPLGREQNTLSSAAQRYTLFGAEMGVGQRHERGFFRWRIHTGMPCLAKRSLAAVRSFYSISMSSHGGWCRVGVDISLGLFNSKIFTI